MREQDRSNKFRIYSLAQLQELPEPQWQIQGMFTTGALIALYGPSGEGKSFLALDWALSIAAGVDWFGRPVEEGQALYVAAEGGRSIRKRATAWLKHRDMHALPKAFFLLENLSVRSSDDIEGLIEQIQLRGLNPDFIVLDTLAKCFGDGDENMARDMNEFVDGMMALHQSTGATVVVIHHTGKGDPNFERGSTALRAGVDAMIRTSMNANKVATIVNNKQKDDDEFANIKFRLKSVVTSEDGGATVTSCVLEPVGASVEQDFLAGGKLKTLKALADCANGVASSAEWRRASGAKDRTFFGHQRYLLEQGLIEELSNGVYRLTTIGRTKIPNATAGAPHMHTTAA